ncbi:transposase [Bacillus timonensis]|nr:transposase [Bacillus timonensis]
MGRAKRIWLPDSFYHIVCRGNQRAPLFKDDGDFLTFLYILKKVNETIPFELASYCLMTNHYHLQLRSREYSISKVMSLINKRYANYYNTKNHLSGHVFEKRYFDQVIKSERGMLEVSRYIHLNPLEANIVNRLEDYRWSSYPFYHHSNLLPYEYVKMEIILSAFCGSEEERRKAYIEFMLEEREEVHS